VAITAQVALDQTTKLYTKLMERKGPVTRADEYFRGQQPLRFASEKWREFHASRYERFCDNWCGPVANSPNERLRIDGFRLDEDPAISDSEKVLWRDWQANDMEAQASQGLLSSIIGRRSFVLVWGDDDSDPVCTWERADQIIVGYDVERIGQRTAALKTWHDDDTEYATLYTPDEVWKWQRPYTTVMQANPGELPPRAEAFFFTPAGLLIPVIDSKGWKPRQSAGDNTWPLPNPLGVVPVVEFPNRPMLGGEPLSEIDGTAAMQDAINLLWAYMFTAADFASMPARVVLGQAPPMIPVLDNAGQKVGERPVDLKKLAEDRILWLTGENTKISQWDAAKLDVFTTVIETAVTHIAAQTRTPPHYLVLGKGLVNVNAEGMKAAETGLVMKVEEMQTFFGPSTREVFRLMALVRNDQGVADQTKFGAVQWRDAENHSEAQLVDALVKLQTIGFPFRWLAERYGLSQTELQRVLAMKETEAANNPAVKIAGALAGTSAPPTAPGPVPAGVPA
jgi:hypothetical protein